MAKFDPLAFNYELVSEESGIFHFQKIILKEDCVLTDIIELSYWSDQKCWVIFLEMINLKQFLPNHDIPDESHPISLFIGEIRSDFDFRFIMNKIVKDAQIIIKLGS